MRIYINQQLEGKTNPKNRKKKKKKKFPFGYCLQSLAQIPTTRNHLIN